MPKANACAFWVASDVEPDSAVKATDAAVAPPERCRYVDVFRGLLIAHMALDHASPNLVMRYL